MAPPSTSAGMAGPATGRAAAGLRHPLRRGRCRRGHHRADHRGAAVAGGAGRASTRWCRARAGPGRSSCVSTSLIPVARIERTGWPRTGSCSTGLPILDRGGFFAREQPSRSYCVVVEARGDRPDGMFLSVEQPTRSLRTVGDSGLLVGDNGHVVGRPGRDTPGRPGRLGAAAGGRGTDSGGADGRRRV